MLTLRLVPHLAPLALTALLCVALSSATASPKKAQAPVPGYVCTQNDGALAAQLVRSRTLRVPLAQVLELADRARDKAFGIYLKTMARAVYATPELSAEQWQERVALACPLSRVPLAP